LLIQDASKIKIYPHFSNGLSIKLSLLLPYQGHFSAKLAFSTGVNGSEENNFGTVCLNLC
jgi:hypothetical protein